MQLSSRTQASDKTSESEDTHLFTPQEAGKLLPDIKPKIKELVELKKAVSELQKEFEMSNLIGFMTQDLAEKAAQLDAFVDRIRTGVSELSDIGVTVRDLEFGLVDFPAERFGQKVFLCWRYGESEVSFWHPKNEGYATRKSIKIQLIQP